MRNLLRSKKMGVLLIVRGGLLVGTLNVIGAARTVSVTGNWNSTATWGGLSVPGTSDAVTINSGITVTIPSGYAAKCTTINFTTVNSGASSITFTDATSSLIASGTSMNGRTGNIFTFCFFLYSVKNIN